MKQIVDLQNDARLASLDTQLVSIGIDSAKALSLDAARLGITAPLLSDADGGVSKAYGLPLKWSGKPGHIFVLAGKDGLVKWVKDYAIPGQNAVMYVNGFKDDPGEFKALMLSLRPRMSSRK